MFREYECDVLVVGAGPVGLLAAVELARQGVRIQVVDAEGGPAARSYSLTLHSRSLELLDELGLADDLIAKGRRIDRCAFYKGDSRRAELDLSKLDSKFPFVLILSQQELEEALEEALGNYPVKVNWRNRVLEMEFDGKLATSRIEKLRKAFSSCPSPSHDWVVDHTFLTNAYYVIGADGSRSIVRHSVNLGWRDLGGPQRFAVVEVQAQTKAAASAQAVDEMRVALNDENTDVLWPMREGRFRFGFQLDRPWRYSEPRVRSRSEADLGGQAFPVLSKRDLRDLILERFPWFKSPLGEVTWSAVLRFERRLANRFGRDNAWLAGDSAHLAPPVGFQSMNIGLREARDLARRIGSIVTGQAKQESLEEFNRERQAEWQSLFQGPERIESAKGWTRGEAAKILSCIPASGSDLCRLAGQIGIQLKS
ncbi:MAG: FAD-dependent monooxygenase [Acidobacteriota bacterium]